MSVARSHSLSVGIVGLPNAGKSTVFNSLTKKSVPAENFPFCTIDKNIGIVEIPDERLKKMSEFFKAEKIVPSAIKFVDIAGLVKGASKGEGLGNQFLAHIKEVDVIMYVLRAFSSSQVVHVYDRVDPIEDFEIAQAELILKDLESVEARLTKINKEARTTTDKNIHLQKEILENVYKWLDSGNPVIDMNLSEEGKIIVDDLFLLTNKHRLFILNCKEGLETEKISEWEEKLAEITKDFEKKYIERVDVKFIGELSEMSQEEIKDIEELVGAKTITVDDVIMKAYERLDLITFYTGSKKECNSWTIKKGATIKEAAGVIHTDLEKNFITADVINIDRMLELGGWNNAKEVGEVKNYGKDYLIRDGDYIIVLANA